ncbi:MAG TPA: ABC transporter transmembrane domain-containing protein [Polyangiales bacterium]|nr:ABC transporter transmembrane domain-containing protein [Polyangiales bacterium]
MIEIPAEIDPQRAPAEPAPSLAKLRDVWKREQAADNIRSFFSEVVSYMLGERRAVMFILSAALLEAAMGLVSPWIAARAIDVALPNLAPRMLTLLAIGIVAAVLHTAWAGWLHERASVVLQERLTTRTQVELMRRYLNASFADLQSMDYGGNSVTFNAASGIVQTYVRSAADVVTQGASGIASLAMLASYDTGLAATVVAMSLVTALIATLLSFREMHFAARNMGAASEAQQLLYTLLQAVTTLRAFQATERLIRRWTERASAQARQAIAMETTRMARGALLLAAQQGVTFIATVWLVHQAVDGTISLGVMTTCTMLVGHVLHASLGITQSCLSVFVMRPMASRVDAMRKRTLPATGPRRRVNPAGIPERNVNVQNVWYRYQPTGAWVLQDYSRLFEERKHTILRAASGSGKSTLLRMIAGLVAPEHGRVFVCGEDPLKVSGLVAYVPQQSILLDSSIGANLAALSGGNLERALELAEASGLSELLARLPMGLETLVAGAGSNLSAGQRQLVVLTAACATRQPVLLLDEVVSQLDAHSRELIQWDALLMGRTVISVHHS